MFGYVCIYIYNKFLEFLARPCCLFIYLPKQTHFLPERVSLARVFFLIYLSCACPFPGPSVLFVGEGFLGRRRCWTPAVEMLYVGLLISGLEGLGLLEVSVGFALGNALFLVRG